jgi:exopolyphosphatase/guanosine-5'-triphosphate,3'-diphosphate pyrophosphatase
LRVLGTLTLDVRLSPNEGEPRDRLSERALREGVGAVRQLLEFARSHGAQKIRAVTTSMVRDAANGAEFVALVREQTGIALEILSGEDEARGIAAGALTDPALAGGGAGGDAGTLRIVDLGGGSLEYIVVERGAVRVAESRPLGAVRLTRQFVHASTAPIPAGELAAVEQHVREIMLPVITAGDAITGGATAGAPFVGCGGVFTVCRMLFAERDGVAGDASSPFLPAERLRSLRDELAALPAERRVHPPALTASRADIFPVALTILITLADIAGASGFTQTFRNLRYGLAQQLATQR